MVRRLFVVLAAVALAIGAVACSKNKEDAGVNIDVGDGGNADGSEPIVITSGSSQVAIGTAELPEGFPSEFPLPDDATPVYSFADTSGSFVWFSSGMSTDDLNAFFQSELPANGWSIDSTFSMSGADGSDVTSLGISGNGWSGAIAVGNGGDASAGFGGEFAFYVTLTAETTPSPTST